MRQQKEEVSRRGFFNLYNHGFIRVAACIPEVRVSDPVFNTDKTIDMVKQCAEGKAVLAVFPELGLSGYTNEDLFFQDALLKSVEDNLQRILEQTSGLDIITVVGAPLKIMNALYNCGVVINKGEVAGIAVKTYLPNYREFYELRHFRSANDLSTQTTSLCGVHDIPIGSDLIFDVGGIPNMSVFVEICEDLWAPIPPSSHACLGGATIVANLSASNITVGKDEYRHDLAQNQSARCMASYIYTAAGPGESTTDLAWDGHALIYENGSLLKESKRFSWEQQVIFADTDLDRLVKDRMISTSFSCATQGQKDLIRSFRKINLDAGPPKGRVDLSREIPRFPYVPAKAEQRDKRCYEIYNIQVQGLSKRIKSSGLDNLVIGVSGGIDSTHALIVCARTLDMLGLPRGNIKAYTMPGYATSEKTYANARALMKALGIEDREIDIKDGCEQMMKDIGHPFAHGRDLYDVTFENVQAGQRTSILFRLANMKKAMVVGTGDLSELALGWCTYGVGDHMSHYNVNASVPKTLIQYLLRWVVDRDLFGDDVSSCIWDILDTEISPELIPGLVGDQPAHSTEAIIGPYELQDFNVYYTTRFGYSPTKVAYLCWNAWRDVNRGLWPDVPPDKRNQYTLGRIKHWLEVFLRRFFRQSQFKRSCVPNGPKVGSGGSLSPRGDYRAPSDSEDTPWIEDLAAIPDRE